MLHLQKLFLIFPDLKFQYFKLIIYSLIISTFDFLSIFLVAPIIKFIIDPNYLKDSQLNIFYSIFDQLGNNFILFLLSIFMVAVQQLTNSGLNELPGIKNTTSASVLLTVN